jgi:hypothetical protein
VNQQKTESHYQDQHDHESCAHVGTSYVSAEGYLSNKRRIMILLDIIRYPPDRVEGIFSGVELLLSGLRGSSHTRSSKKFAPRNGRLADAPG